MEPIAQRVGDYSADVFCPTMLASSWSAVLFKHSRRGDADVITMVRHCPCGTRIEAEQTARDMVAVAQITLPDVLDE